MGSRIVQSQYFVCFLVHDGFGVDACLRTAAIFVVLIEDAFFKRHVSDVIDLNMLLPKAMDRVLFTHSTATVLHRCEDCRREIVDADVLFMGFEFSHPQQFSYPAAQVPTHLGCCARQLRQSFHHVPQSVDVVDTRLLQLLMVSDYLLVLGSLHPCRLEVESIRGRRPAHSEQYSIELLRRQNLFGQLVLNNHVQLARLFLLYTDRQGSIDDVHLLLSEIRDDVVDHIAIESSQIVASSHHAHIETHAPEEASDFHSHVPPSNNQGLSRGLLLEKDVVACDGVFSPWDVEVGRSGAGGDDEIFGLDLEVSGVVFVEFWKLASFDKLVDYFGVFRTNDGVFVFESSQAVEVVHLVQPVHSGHVAKVNRFYVALDFPPQLLPTEDRTQLFFFLTVVHSQLPPVVIRVYDLLLVLGRLMHQLLWDASHVDACATQAPLRLVQTLLHEVDHDHIKSVLVGLKGSRQASRASSDDCEVIEVVVVFDGGERVFEEGEGESHSGCPQERAADGGCCSGVGSKSGDSFSNHNYIQV